MDENRVIYSKAMQEVFDKWNAKGKFKSFAGEAELLQAPTADDIVVGPDEFAYYANAIGKVWYHIWDREDVEARRLQTAEAAKQGIVLEESMKKISVADKQLIRAKFDRGMQADVDEALSKSKENDVDGKLYDVKKALMAHDPNIVEMSKEDVAQAAESMSPRKGMRYAVCKIGDVEKYFVSVIDLSPDQLEALGEPQKPLGQAQKETSDLIKKQTREKMLEKMKPEERERFLKEEKKKQWIEESKEPEPHQIKVSSPDTEKSSTMLTTDYYEPQGIGHGWAYRAPEKRSRGPHDFEKNDIFTLTKNFYQICTQGLIKKEDEGEILKNINLDLLKQKALRVPQKTIQPQLKENINRTGQMLDSLKKDGLVFEKGDEKQTTQTWNEASSLMHMQIDFYKQLLDEWRKAPVNVPQVKASMKVRW